MSDERPRARFGLDVVLNTTIIAALITALGGIAIALVQPNDTPCRIATDFLMDDAKDRTIIDEVTARRLRRLYTQLAERACQE